MKRILNFIITLVCLLACSVGASAYTASDSAEVKTGKELIAAINANKHYIHLIADINMKDYDESVDKFTGEIDGGQWTADSTAIEPHTISGLKESLAVTMEGANIHDIDFKDSEPEWHALSINEGMALISRNSKNCQFWNLTLDNISVSYCGFWRGCVLNPIRHYNGGLVVGKDFGSTFDNITISNSSLYVSSTEGGGVTGDSYGSTFKNIRIEGTCAIHVQGSDNLVSCNSGGVAGRAEGSKFQYCTNEGVVTAALDNVGGIAGGVSKGCTFEYCENSGSVSHMSIDDAEDLNKMAYMLGTSAYDWSMGSKLAKNIRAYKANAANAAAVKAYPGAMKTYMADLKTYDADVKSYQTWTRQVEFRKARIAELVEASHAQAEGGINVGRADAKIQLQKEYDKLDKLRSKPHNEPVKPVKPEEVKAEVKGAPAFTFLDFAMMVIQIAQIVYEAQDNDNVGGIVGEMAGGGKLIACANYGYVNTDDAYGGGIVGEARGGVVINSCHNAGSVQGYEQTGGIVGSITDGSVTGCLNTGNISKGNSSADTFGFIFGENDGANIYGNCRTSNVSDKNFECRSVTGEMLASGEVAIYLNEQAGQKYWHQTINEDFTPTLDSLSTVVTSVSKEKVDLVYHVSSGMGLMSALSNQYAKVYLDNDIEVDGNIFNLSSSYMPFHGYIDGQGHKISNVRHVVSGKHWKIWWNNDNTESHTALLPFAEKATFKNITLDNFTLTIGNGEVDYAALLVSDSKNCKYENIHITGKSTIGDINDGHVTHIGGLIGLSENDSIINCTTGAGCSFANRSGLLGTFYTRPVGGLVAISKGSVFVRCYNAASVYGDDTDYAGGIVAKDEGNSVLKECLNTGSVRASEYVGGLVGYGYGTKLYNSVNTGKVSGIDEEENIGGLVGELEQYASYMERCFNFGEVSNVDRYENSGALVGKWLNKQTTNEKNCYYYCKVNGSQNSTFDSEDLEKVQSGEYVYELNENSKKTIWYQSIDDNYSFPTRYPVPIAEAGEVHENNLCDDVCSIDYSNKYQAAEDHTRELSNVGICKLCGYQATTPDADAVVDIASATDLMDFATLTLKSADYQGLSARLMADIDLQGCNFPGISSQDIPYRGTFHGRGHRISNMNLTGAAGKACGFFTCLSDGAVVDSLVVDSTCTVTGTGGGVAGIAGCTITSKDGSVTISNCGNEATVVTTGRNAAGILGGVYNNTAKLVIKNCYNIGYISGTSESASICGYARNSYSISNCYNAGIVGVTDNGKPMYRADSYDSKYVSNCYDVNGKQTGVSAVSLDKVLSGELCWILNGKPEGTHNVAVNGFYQNTDSELSYPTVIPDTDNEVAEYDSQYCTGEADSIFYNPSNTPKDLHEARHIFDANGYCTAKEGETHYEKPALVDNVYQISKPGHLYWIAKQAEDGWDAKTNCILLNDIVVNDTVNKAVAAGNTSGLRSWIPIGTEDHPYHGATFDGNGHTISGLYLYAPWRSGVGFFGFAYNLAVIKNLGIVDCYFYGNRGVGAIVGWGGMSYTDESSWKLTNGPELHNSYSSGSVFGNGYTGGLMGFVNDGSILETNSMINNCYSTVKVSSSNEYGALFGYMGESVPDGENLNHCYWDDANCTSDGYNRVWFGTMLDTEYFTTGKVCDLLNHSDCVLLPWSQDLASQDVPCFGEDGVKLTRKVEQKWGTAVLPYTVYSNKDITYFNIDTLAVVESSKIANLVLTPASRVLANTPCFYHVNKDTTQISLISEGRELTIPGTEDVTLTSQYTALDYEQSPYTSQLNFTGTYQAMTNRGDNHSFTDLQEGFILSGDSAMWKATEYGATTVELEPYRAYVYSDGLSDVKQLNIVMKCSDYDLNGDKVFNMKDVDFLYDIVRGVRTSDYLYDLNQDGKCTMADVTFLVDKILSTQTTIVTPPTAIDGVIIGE